MDRVLVVGGRPPPSRRPRRSGVQRGIRTGRPGRRPIGRVVRIVAGQVGQRAAGGQRAQMGAGSGHAAHSQSGRVQPVRQRLLQGGGRCRCCRLSVVQVGSGGRSLRGGVLGRVPAPVGRPAVQSLERCVVASFGEQLQTNGRLSFPFRSGTRRKGGFSQFPLENKAAGFKAKCLMTSDNVVCLTRHTM